MPPSHVLIIGGGLAGPALALSLARQQIRSTIFEIRPTRSDSGGSITLAPNALRALDKGAGAAVYDRIRASGYVYHRIGVYADDGYKFGESAMGEEEEGGYPLVRVMRSVIHQVLLDACGEQGGLVNVIWGAKVSGIENSEKGVSLKFEDGSSATGDVLIGADGIHSKVREYVLGDSAPKPIYSGSCTIASFLPTASVQTPPGMTIPAIIFTPVGLIMVVPVDPEGKTVTFGVSEELPEKGGREGWRDYELSGEAARAARKHYEGVTNEPIRSLLDNMDEKKIRLWAPYGIPDLPRWHKGRVCLIGDAAHALPPNGQGSAMAFEDAALLGRLLGSEHATSVGYDRLFGHFETVRRPRIENVKRLSKNAGQVKADAGAAWKWALKKWAIWAYFGWNRWVMRDSRITAYDVMSEDIEVR